MYFSVEAISPQFRPQARIFDEASYEKRSQQTKSIPRPNGRPDSPWLAETGIDSGSRHRTSFFAKVDRHFHHENGGGPSAGWTADAANIVSVSRARSDGSFTCDFCFGNSSVIAVNNAPSGCKIKRPRLIGCR
jgi:hypothetical protein